MIFGQVPLPQSKVEKSTVQSNGGHPTAFGLSRTVDYNANSNPNAHTVNTVTVASVAVNIVTLNYVIVARVVSLQSLSIIMAFRVLKYC